MEEQKRTIKVRVTDPETLDKENPQLSAKLRAAAELIMESWADCITFRTEDGERKITVSEIMYYETDDRRLSVHTADGSCFHVKMTMKEMGDKLNQESFLMLHRGCAVNLLYVRHILNGKVELVNGERLEVSRRRFPLVRERILKAWEEKA